MFSYLKCFSDMTKIDMKNKTQASHDLTKYPQIRNFKNESFPVNVSFICYTTGNVLYNNSFTHVNHIYDVKPF